MVRLTPELASHRTAEAQGLAGEANSSVYSVQPSAATRAGSIDTCVMRRAAQHRGGGG